MSDLLFVLVTGISSGALYGLVGLAIVITHRATGVLNLSMVALATASMYVALSLVEHVGIWAALVVACGLCAVGGLIVREVLIRPLKDGDAFAGLVITVGLLLAIEHVTGEVWGFHPVSFPTLVEGSVPLGDNYIRVQSLVNIAVAVVAMSAVGYLFRRTALGSAMRAAAEDPASARLIGIDAQRVARVSWALSLSLAGLAAALLVSGASLTPTVLTAALFRALAGILLGGITSMVGAVVGGVLIGVLDNMAAAYLSASYRDTIVFAIAIVVLIARPQGIFGERNYQRV